MSSKEIILQRVPSLEVPHRGLVFWFEDINGQIMASVFNEPNNVYARVTDWDTGEAFEIKYPFQYTSTPYKYEDAFKRSIIQYVMRKRDYDAAHRVKTPKKPRKTTRPTTKKPTAVRKTPKRKTKRAK